MRSTSVLVLAVCFCAAGTLAQDTSHLFQNPDSPADARAKDLVSRMTLDEKIGQMRNSAPAIPRLGIPAYDWWNEALHGVARAGLATVFPQAIGLAATWDKDLEHRITDVISTEARAKYNDAVAHGNHGRYYGLTFWSPNINIFRDPRWGRGQETYGEDPYLTAQMAIQFVRGMQGDDPKYFKTIATSKHYAVHSGPELLRHGFNAQISDEDLNGTYLYAFRQTVEQAHVDSIMCVYNAVDGVPGCASDLLLKQKLRDEWHFTGYVVSDCDAVDDIYRGHHYAKSPAEAAALAVKAGDDLDCGKTYDHLAEAVKSGLITEREIDTSLVRLFTARIKLGMFDPPERVPFSHIGMDQVAPQEHNEVALQAARESIVLLENERNLLPLRFSGKKIAVVGPAADDEDAMLGNYYGIPSHIVTPLAGIERALGPANTVRFSLGASYVENWSAVVPNNVLTTTANGGEHGLKAEYFGDETFSGDAILTRIEQRPLFDMERGDPTLNRALPHDHFAARWTGFIRVRSSGEYQLGVIRPECHSCGRIDQARVYIDGKVVTVDSAKPNEQMFPKLSPIHLDADHDYAIRVEYSQHGGGGGLEFVWTPPASAALHDAVELARDSDVVIACVGLNSRLEGEESPLRIPGFAGGDRTDLQLPEPQRKLLDALFATGKPIAVVLVSGSALAVPEAKAHASAILQAWYGGQEAGGGLADVLSGAYNPAGRLPVTFYKSVDDLPPFTDYAMKNRTYRFFTGSPLYPFGYGLSYSDFRYSDARLNGNTVHASVKNASAVAGDEVVEVYLLDKDRTHPNLRGFERIHLNAGESKNVEFKLDAAELKGKIVSIGSGLPSDEWTRGHYIIVKR